MTFQSIRCTFRLQVLMLCSCRSAFVVYRLDVVIIGLICSYVKYYLALFLNYFLCLKSRLTLIQADKYPVIHQVFAVSVGIYGLIF